MKACSSAWGVSRAISVLRKYVGIEISLHGEAGAEESESFQAQGFGCVAGCLHDAHQWNRRLLPNFVEHDVRRVGGQQADTRSGVGQFLNFTDEVLANFSSRSASIRSSAALRLMLLMTIDGIASVGLQCAVGRNQMTVVFDGRLRPDASDHSDRLHAASSRTFLSLSF